MSLLLLLLGVEVGKGLASCVAFHVHAPSGVGLLELLLLSRIRKLLLLLMLCLLGERAGRFQARGAPKLEGAAVAWRGLHRWEDLLRLKLSRLPKA